MVMAAVSLLDEVPNPTERDVRIGIEGKAYNDFNYENYTTPIKSFLVRIDRLPPASMPMASIPP